MFQRRCLLVSFSLLLLCSPLAATASNIRDAAIAALPSVVRIDVILTKQGLSERRDGQSPQSYRATNGAGFVADRHGHIVTAAHVVRDAFWIEVVLDSGETFPADVVGVDDVTDVAVLYVPNELPPPLEIAKALPSIATPVAAIGSPYGMSGTVSLGAISGFSRPRRVSAPAIHLQHDAAINPGNSGGPVISANGEVLGINVAIPDGQFEFAGIALAVEAPVLRHIVF